MAGHGGAGSVQLAATAYETLQFGSTVLLLVACLVLGGGGGWFGDTFVQLLALPVLLLACLRWPSMRRDPWVSGLLVGVVLLAMLQLMPLPPAIWHALPMRTALLAQMHSAGVATSGWHPLTLSPIATERTLLWILPGIAVLLSTLQMRSSQRGWLLLVLLAVAFVSVLLGMLQLAGGPASEVRLYRPTSVLDAVGFFANRDHFAAFVAMVMPLAIGWLALLVQPIGRGRRLRTGWIVLLCLVIIGLLLGLLLSHSRAGLVFAVLGLAAGLVLLARSRLARRALLALSAVGVVGVLLGIQFALSGVLDRMVKNPANDPRWAIHANTLDAAGNFVPFGSGLGTFVEAYQTIAPERNLQSHLVNHANNDYYELWLEAGWPAALLVAGFLAWYLRMTAVVWLQNSPGSPDADLTLARAASISLALVLLHSAIDYPLRNTATIAVFGLSCGLLATAAARKRTA